MFIVSENGVSMAKYDTYTSIFKCRNDKAGLVIGRNGEKIKSVAKECHVNIGKGFKEENTTTFKISGNRVGNVEKAYLKMLAIVTMKPKGDEKGDKKGDEKDNVKREGKYNNYRVREKISERPVNMCDVIQVRNVDFQSGNVKSKVSKSRKVWWNKVKKNLKKKVILEKKDSKYYWGVIRGVVVK